MSSANVLNAFNNHFFEFISDIQSTFPDDADLQTAKNYMTMMRKANPKMIAKIWQKNIASKYHEQIAKGDLTFFLEKDYTSDVQNNENSSQIINCINRFKTPIKEMTKENQAKSMKYIQNLTELSQMIS
jgi:hypothetical protein